ncbi:fatty-acid--CoA ligase [bacterium]|nr:MAG: fatty-acid--CoA ligase [bacterium]
MQGLMMKYPLTMDRILERANRMYPNKEIATKLPDSTIHRYTYADFYKRVKRLANVLKNLDVEGGDRVGTFSWNNYQHLELYYAIPCYGAVIHTINIRLSVEQLVYTINHAEDKVIFIDATLLPLFEKAASQFTSVKHFVVFNSNQIAETTLPNILYYEDLISEADPEYQWQITDENTAMGLCYTSGTTGNSKGVLYSHRSMYLHTIGEGQTNSLGITDNDRVLTVVPMFHAMCWGLPYSCANSGAELVMPGPHLNPASLAEIISEEKVTVAAGVPTIWLGLYQELKAKPRDMSKLRNMVVGGSAMPRSLIEAYEKEFGIDILHAWGMTETSPLATVCKLQPYHQDLPDHQKWDIKARQGYAVSGIELRIVNEQGEELPWDGTTMGELQIIGSWVTSGYYKTEPSPEHFTKDGWFRTGDVATIMHDGCMAITDRTKDLVKSGGEWISSVALENSLMAHPDVLEASVIAIPDDKWGERPLGVIVLKPNVSNLTEEDFKNHLMQNNFAKFWIPEKFVFIKEVPKTSVGKFDKKVIRKRYADGLLV